ncbi:glutenin, high molecular weight subunit PW212-like isoform X2 [Maniola jurtina]|uniref:glutenin, high molecular weight subunit PW212-like isoform X2 n=1 Tax=Maniola jurtina TaxID=191418 RepID=UPI001E6878EA|nr:glutenin, high molecular weight subunit PW212-like isoform X2 [Maniola jurtina]
MNKWCLFLVLAILSNEALGFSYRNKRQAESDSESNSGDEDLEDRYGWNRPNRPNRPNWQWQGQEQFPNQWQFPNQGQNQFPNQGQDQFPNQGQNQFPNQGQNQFPNQGQGQFPNQGQNQFPNQEQGQFPNQGQGQQNSTPTPNAATTQSATAQACMTGCPVTSEYNPVCGSNGVTYDNPGRLTCAQACGVNVNLLRASRCPTATAAPVN